MNKEFIPYEQALALKELGFDEPCFGHYLKKQFYLKMYDKQSEGITLRPTFSQAFRWFRKKYNIQSCIDFTRSNYKFEIHFQRLANGETPPVMVWHYVDSWLGMNIGLFNTYEEAELACLKKLIEIANEKSI